MEPPILCEFRLLVSFTIFVFIHNLLQCFGSGFRSVLDPDPDSKSRSRSESLKMITMTTRTMNMTMTRGLNAA